MLLKNAKNYMRAHLFKTSGTAYGFLPITDMGGASAYMTDIAVGNIVEISFGDSASTGNGYIIIGSGSTPATENDYALESRITSGLSVVSYTPSKETDANGNVIKRFDFTLQNTSGSDITIAEVGIRYYIQGYRTGAGTTGSTKNGFILFERTVLSTPVTIAAGDAAAIRYTVESAENN